MSSVATGHATSPSNGGMMMSSRGVPTGQFQLAYMRCLIRLPQDNQPESARPTSPKSHSCLSSGRRDIAHSSPNRPPRDFEGQVLPGFGAPHFAVFRSEPWRAVSRAHPSRRRAESAGLTDLFLVMTSTRSKESGQRCQLSKGYASLPRISCPTEHLSLAVATTTKISTPFTGSGNPRHRLFWLTIPTRLTVPLAEVRAALQ